MSVTTDGFVAFIGNGENRLGRFPATLSELNDALQEWDRIMESKPVPSTPTPALDIPRLQALLETLANEKQSRGEVVATFTYGPDRNIAFEPIPPDYVTDEALLRSIAERLPSLVESERDTAWKAYRAGYLEGYDYRAFSPATSYEQLVAMAEGWANRYTAARVDAALSSPDGAR